MKSRGLRIAVSLILMVALIGVFLWNVDLKEVGRALERASLPLVLASIVIALFSYWLRALRWMLILRPAGGVRHSNAVVATIIGYTAITLLPARMGDIIRPVLLARREPRLPTSAALASILTERLFDLWTVVLFFLVFVAWPPQMAELDAEARRNLEILSLSGYAVGAGLIVGTALLLALFRYQERFVELVTRPIGRIRQAWQQPLANFLHHFLDGLRVLQRPRDLAVTTGASILLWYVIYWQVKVTLLAFDIDLPLRVSYFLVTMAVIGMAVPTPGGVGGFHKATQIGLTTFFGVELNRATAVAIVYHAVCFIPITIIGLLLLPTLGLSFRDVDSLRGEAEQQ